MRKVLLLIAASLVWLYIKIVFIFSKIEIISNQEIAKARHEKRIIIMAWHNRLLLLGRICLLFKPRKAGAVISSHRDADILLYLNKLYGYTSFRGSSNRMSVTSMRGVMQALRDNYILAVTPDGPTGPKYIVKGVMLRLAKQYNYKILLLSYNCSRKIILNTWDNIIIPLPFGKITFNAKLVSIDKNEDFESARKRINQIMLEQITG